jgi:hypothetical protein
MALSGSTVWEVRTAGSDTNGGGFVTGASGTDWSQQDAVKYALTGLTTAAANAIISTASASADMVGNIIQITSGTNFTAGFYQIISVSAGVSITVDRNCTTAAGAAGVGNIGGALATVNQAIVNMTINGMIAYIKAGSYTRTTTMTLNGTGGKPYTLIGYTSTRTDNGQATITTASNITLVTYSGGNIWIFKNLVFSSTAGTAGQGFDGTNSSYNISLYFINCLFSGLKDALHTGSSVGFTPLHMDNCEIKNCTNVGIEFLSSSSTLVLLDSFIHGCTSDGIACSSNALTLFMVRSIVYNNSGKGVNLSSNNSHQIYCYDSAICSNTSDGLAYTNAGIQNVTLVIHNTIIQSNGGWGLNINTTGGLGYQSVLNNAFRNNTSGNYTAVVTSTGEVTLTGDPFTAAGTDFSLNNTAGAGAACRQAGFPGVLQTGGTGYADIGPLRHQDPAAGSTYLGGSAAGMSSIMAM